MLQSLSETVIVPIAAAILALVMCYELIEMIVEKNNMHDFDSSMFFRWMFKSAFAILIVTNTWNIVMGVFDATQAVVNQSGRVIIGETSIDFDTLLPDLESRLEAMDIGPLLGLWFQTLVVGLTMNILSICIFLVTYGRMIEIYAVTALGPIPLATLGNAEWRGMGQNYLKSLLALGFQAFLIMVVVGIYAVLIQEIERRRTFPARSGAAWATRCFCASACSRPAASVRQFSQPIDVTIFTQEEKDLSRNHRNITSYTPIRRGGMSVNEQGRRSITIPP